MWAERPAPPWVPQMAVVRVMYLLELRVRLLEKMLTDFIDGVDIFLGLHRDADAATLTKLQVHLSFNIYSYLFFTLLLPLTFSMLRMTPCIVV